MTESYVVNNGGEGREVPIVKRANPLDSILEAPKAKKNEEKAVGQLPTAGDVTVQEYKDSFAGKEEAVETSKKEIVYGHCNNCRVELTEDKVVKNAIDFQRNEDGTLSKACSRFSVFCKNCMKFITVIDFDAQKLLNDMIRKGIK